MTSALRARLVPLSESLSEGLSEKQPLAAGKGVERKCTMTHPQMGDQLLATITRERSAIAELNASIAQHDAIQEANRASVAGLPAPIWGALHHRRGQATSA